MNRHGEKQIGTREKEDALLNFVNYQAQEAILNPSLPSSYKDDVLEAAIGTIRKVAERKAAYYAKYGEGRRRKPHIIYEAGSHEDEEQENIPRVIAELNEISKRRLLKIARSLGSKQLLKKPA